MSVASGSSPLGIHPVILCGGAGTRLWPASRRNQPKQFALTFDGLSLFQLAANMVSGPGFAPPVVVAGVEQRFRVAAQLADLNCESGAVLVEPDARNTAPAVLAAALHIQAHDPQGVLLVVPSDHRIADHAAFRAAVSAALPHALAGHLVTFGIRPTRPETGYGYLKLIDPDSRHATTPQRLSGFVEKPDMVRAQAMLEEGLYMWNAGIFLMSVDAVIAAYRSHAADILTAVCDAMADVQIEPPFTHIGTRGWMQAPAISVDYAIMEKATNLVVMPYQGQWSDLGDWSSVWRDGKTDETGNLIKGDVVSIDCQNSILSSDVPDQMVVGLDLDNLVVVATPDAILVAPQGSSQKVGALVNRLHQLDRSEGSRARRDDRTWGWYERIAVRPGYQVKQIVVRPRRALSLQSHQHRAEHWIILSGTAHVTVAEAEQALEAEGYVFVPQGAVHRLENRGEVPLVLVEVQVGSYLGDDDITRYAVNSQPA